MIAKIETMKLSDGETLLEMRGIIKTLGDDKTLNWEKLSYSSNMDKEFQNLRNDYVKSLSKNIKKRFHKTDGEFCQILVWFWNL